MYLFVLITCQNNQINIKQTLQNSIGYVPLSVYNARDNGFYHSTCIGALQSLTLVEWNMVLLLQMDCGELCVSENNDVISAVFAATRP